MSDEPRQQPAESEPIAETPRPESREMTADELAEARHYGRLNLRVTLIDMVVDVAFLAVIALAAARPIDLWLQRSPLLAGNWSLRLLALTGIVFAIHFAISFPLSYYSGYRLEHRFKLSKLTLAGWLWRYAKQAMLSVGFSLALFLGLFWIIWTTGPYWWLVAAGAFFVVSILLGQLLPVLILPLFYRVQRLDAPELTGRLARLAEGTGLTIEGVYRLALSEETVKGNAMLAGLGRTRRVLIGDTLLEGYSPDEIEVIFAHEIGHHLFGHIHKLIAIGFLYSALGFWFCDWLLRAWVGHFEGLVDYSHLPVYTLPLILLILRVFSIVVEPLQNAIARRFERQCDRYALKRTGLNEAYLSAFRKLARLNKSDPDPPWLEVFWFHSHPPIRERLRLAETASR
jgi:STE24 endopeptidase